ncbi:MAG: 50S ribosomal protein L15 [Buchnera aphidicola (Pentalonia nigronervosa)]|jgi:large subunit ribosomal protein L15|uniref:Large ribosomal subunit protein uL15 n=1 Tax=Buchnera aphidicola (Pentalonia nigronervosa) TaxID=1309793 RepID=A0A7H1AYX5_9GAMM|nr:MAG: 50S ribosomal protein L15 [Buchnera aphidicola (Pentalonia nigronervosa)]
MYLNTLSPAYRSRKSRTRLGRGIGSGFGKTAGRGHKGQKSRSGSRIRRGFEGGQMPLYRRLPKFGFNSRKKNFVAEVRLSEIENLSNSIIDLDTLKKKNIIRKNIKHVKIIFSGKINRSLKIRGLLVTKGARSEIEKFGGIIEG